MKRILMQLAVAGMLAVGTAQADFYVAPNGSDAAPGTLQEPFASPARAQDAVRLLLREGLAQDVTVWLRGGQYPIDAPLVFGPEDSGTSEYSVTYAAYENEAPVLSGGRTISGWKDAGGGKWQVELPAVKSGEWGFRQLFADGVRLPRGRYPNGDGLLTVESVSPEVTQITLAEAPELGAGLGADAELVMYQNWSISRMPIVAMDGKTATMAHPMGWMGHGPATTASPGKPCFIENALAFVDQPGEWYLDRASGVLTYQAAAGEDPNNRMFVAPTIEHLVIVAGTPEKPVQHLRFEGLTFEFTEWPLPAFGYLGIQAGHHGTTMQDPAYVLPAALEISYAVGGGLTRCRVAHTGASGVALGAGCCENRVTNCQITDIGGNGVMVGWRSKAKGASPNQVLGRALDSDWPSPADVPTDNEVSNCTITACGAVNQGCVGISDAFCANTKIAHNLVAGLPYTGISIGFRWDSSETSQRGCIVEYNDVHDVMKMLADGGAIYTLGFQPGTVLRGNLLHDVQRSAFAHGGAPNNGIFFDQGSKGYLVEGNIIYATSGDPLRFNQTGKENFEWKDNSLGVAPSDPAFPKDAALKAGPLP